MQQSTPNYSVPSGPSAEQLAIANMGQFAGQPNSLSAILANLSALTQPTMAPSSPAVNVLIGMPSNATTATARGTVPASGGTGPAGSSATPGSASSLLSDAQSASKLYNALTGSGAMGIPSVLSGPQQAALQSAFTGAPVAGSLADAMGLTAGTLSPLAASALAPVGTGAITAAGDAAGAAAASELAGAGASGAAGAAAGAGAAGAGAGAAGAGSGAALGATAGALGAIGIAALPLVLGLTTPAVSVPSADFTNMLNTVSAGKKAGYVMPGQASSASPLIQSLLNNPQNFNNPGPGGAPSYSSWMNALAELQGGAYEPQWAVNALNALGFPTDAQALKGAPAAAGSSDHSLGNSRPVSK